MGSWLDTHLLVCEAAKHKDEDTLGRGGGERVRGGEALSPHVYSQTFSLTNVLSYVFHFYARVHHLASRVHVRVYMLHCICGGQRTE